jgi:hypothetical protein
MNLSSQGVVDVLPNHSMLTIEVFIFQVVVPGIMSVDYSSFAHFSKTSLLGSLH